MRVIQPSAVTGLLVASGQVLRPKPGTSVTMEQVTVGGPAMTYIIDDVELGPIVVPVGVVCGYLGGFVHAPVPLQVVQAAEPEMIPAFRPDRDPQGTPVAMIPSF